MKSMNIIPNKNIPKPPNRSKELLEVTCFQYGRKEHYANNCPTKPHVHATEILEEENNSSNKEIHAINVNESENQLMHEEDENLISSQYDS